MRLSFPESFRQSSLFFSDHFRASWPFPPPVCMWLPESGEVSSTQLTAGSLVSKDKSSLSLFHCRMFLLLTGHCWQGHWASLVLMRIWVSLARNFINSWLYSNNSLVCLSGSRLQFPRMINLFSPTPWRVFCLQVSKIQQDSQPLPN